MKHEVFTCDRCGPRVPAVQFMELEVEGPPATDEANVTQETRRIDLCARCTARVLQYLVRGLGLEPKRLLLDYALKPDKESARG
jgi:hypothetical protein